MSSSAATVIAETQFEPRLREEGALLLYRVDQRHPRLWRRNRQHHARQAAAAADIKDPRRRPRGDADDMRHQRQRVEQMVRQHVIGAADGGQVVCRVPPCEQTRKRRQPCQLRLVERNTKLRRARADDLRPEVRRQVDRAPQDRCPWKAASGAPAAARSRPE